MENLQTISFRPLWPTWPLVFKLRPSELSFAQQAESVIDNTARIPAPPEEVYDEFTELRHAREWLDQFVRIDLLTPDEPLEHRIYLETFTFMSLRIRAVQARRGHFWANSVDRCSLPLASQLLEVATFEPTGDGGTDFRWLLYYTPTWLMRIVRGIVEPQFRRLFHKSTEQLAAFFQRQGGPSENARGPLRRVQG